jgi:phenylalanyl-tRNA synthetase beta chain
MKKFSKKWMQTFVDGQLPQDDNYILTQVSKKGFEVEGFEKSLDGDTLFEIKVLPNRIADAFSVRGMAREFAAVFGLGWGGKIAVPKMEGFALNNDHVTLEKKDKEQPIYIFTGVKISNFDNTIPTPDWIKDIIEKSGGRSINCLVDITNLMLFSFGQPAHVFDFEKMSGNVVTRFAHAGEEIELLDGKKIKLTEEDFVIADEVRALSRAAW